MENEKKQEKCNKRTEVYSRVVGFYANLSNWNKGKREEFKDRKHFIVK